MKILTVTYNDLGISWGPAVHFLELWNEAARHDQEVEIVGYAPSWTGLPPIVEPLFPLTVRRVPNLPFVRQIIWDARIALKIVRVKADVVYVRLSYFHLFALLALLFVRHRVAVEVNGGAKQDNKASKAGVFRTWLARLSERMLLRRADVVFSVTEKLVETSRAVNPRAVHVHVDNGVARSFFEAQPDPVGPIRFIYVGTYTAWDGAERIVELARQRPNLSFTMVGDGARRADIERGAPANVRFRGWCDYRALNAEYSACNAGIVLYHEERHRHMSMSSLKTREYLAAGLPVLSTRVLGQEFIDQRGWGLLASGDLAAETDRFVASYTLYRRNLAAASDEIFRTYSWAAAAAKTLGALAAARIQRG